MSPRRCPAYATVSPGREVRCDKPAAHGPAEDVHHGLLRVILPDGTEQAASIVWSSTRNPWDEKNLARST